LPSSRYVQPAQYYDSMLTFIQMKNSVKRGLFHPSDIKTVGLGNVSPGPSTAPLPSIGHRRHPSRPLLSPITPTSPLPGPPSARSISQSYTHAHTRSTSSLNTNGSLGRAGAESRMSDFDKYAEDDDEDYDDIFGKSNGNSMHNSALLLRKPVILTLYSLGTHYTHSTT
jgi:hypothetical protein